MSYESDLSRRTRLAQDSARGCPAGQRWKLPAGTPVANLSPTCRLAPGDGNIIPGSDWVYPPMSDDNDES